MTCRPALEDGRDRGASADDALHRDVGDATANRVRRRGRAGDAAVFLGTMQLTNGIAPPAVVVPGGQQRSTRGLPTGVPIGTSSWASAGRASATPLRNSRIMVFISAPPVMASATVPGASAAMSLLNTNVVATHVAAMAFCPVGLGFTLISQIGHRHQARHGRDAIEEPPEVVVPALQPELDRPLRVLGLGDDRLRREAADLERRFARQFVQVPQHVLWILLVRQDGGRLPQRNSSARTSR